MDSVLLGLGGTSFVEASALGCAEVSLTVGRLELLALAAASRAEVGQKLVVPATFSLLASRARTASTL